ncbi:hypothetical protein TWF506_007775 [Arthrobotrys conoides]|uniref:Uncharacterized protein n=1 Tax=Arthrobotrys conoides TaxID=74498 RepID=A0AAN8NG64_9PEZI
MRERIRRYIPSFKQRNLHGQGRGSRATFLDATGDERDGTPTANERDMETALARVRQLESRRDKGPVAGQRHRRRNVVVAKRQEIENDPTPLPVIVSEIVGGNRPVGVAGATVTVSIGLSLQITTVSLEGSTFVSVSSSWFTFDATGGISSVVPTSTSDTLTTTTTWAESTSTSTSASDSSSPIETSTTALTSSSSELTSEYPTPSSLLTTFTTSPTPTSVASAAFDEATLSLSDVPVVYPTTLSASMVSSRNMTAHGILRTETTVRKTSTPLEISTTSRSSSRRTSSSSSSSSSSTSQYSSTRISPSIEVAASTIYPAESEPTTPLDSPTTSVEASPDAGLGSGGGNQPANENLPPILGGVFGGLAGIGLVLWALLFLLRKRRRTSERTVGILGPGTRGGHHRAISAETGAGSVGEMSQARTSLMPGFLGASVLFGRSSADTAAEPAERGFVKISGRKLPSMYGGDDMVPASIAVANARASVSETGSRNVSGGTHHAGGTSSSARGSFYQDDDILHAPTPSPFHPGAARTAMRSGSPAHVSRISEDEPALVQTRRPPPPPPIINEPAEGSSRYPTPPPGAVRRMHSLIGPDGVGRSLASQDGSKTSRFTEDV